MADSPGSVFVTGANGFIAQHIVKLLLARRYGVFGTVRSSEKGEKLKTLFQSDKFQYEVVPDIGRPGAFDEALKNHPEVEFFFHTASPFHYKPKDIEDDLLLPAVNGTKNALNAIKKNGNQIKNVVVTSSYVAMWDVAQFYNKDHRESEKSWSSISWEEAIADAHQGYYGSKKFAEKAAWDFMNEESPKFAINFVNPVLVFGPQAFDSEIKEELNTSAEMINGLLKLRPDSEVPQMASVFVDVRDVAQAHIAAIESNMSNKRLLLYSSKFSNQGILDIINKNFGFLNGQVPYGNPGSGHAKESTICQIDNERTKSLLGFELMSLETSVVDTVAQIVRTGKLY